MPHQAVVATNTTERKCDNEAREKRIKGNPETIITSQSSLETEGRLTDLGYEGRCEHGNGKGGEGRSTTDRIATTVNRAGTVRRNHMLNKGGKKVWKGRATWQKGGGHCSVRDNLLKEVVDGGGSSGVPLSQN